MFTWVSSTFHLIYSNTGPFTKHHLPNNSFQHSFGGLRATYSIYSSMTILPCQKITSQHDSNHSTTHIISIVSKIFTWVNSTFHSMYSNTGPSTKHHLQNNLFQHSLGGLRSTYPIYSSMTILPCQKNCLNMIQTIELHISF